MEIENVKVTVKQVSGWDRAKECALQTIGKKMVNLPDADWERKMLLCEHAPIRAVEYDRTDHTVPRAERPQGQLVSVLLSVNAQAVLQC